MNKIESKIKKNEPLIKYTHFRIGGPADYLLEAETEDDIVAGIEWADKKRLPLTVLGGGSNVLVLDKGIRGLVIITQNKEIEIKDNQVTAGAGVVFMNLVNILADKGFSGLEFGCGIYGTIGGAVRGNAGSFGREIKDVLISAVLYQPAKGRVVLSNKELNFSYRHSIFFEKKDWVILRADFSVSPSSSAEVKKTIKEFLQKKVSSQPMGKPSSGCIFRNPEIEPEKFQELKKHFAREYANLSFWQSDRIGAGFLIEAAGLKGKKIGAAQISEKHGTFIVNTGKATAEQVLMLISYTKQQIRDKYGVQLQEEIEILGE